MRAMTAAAVVSVVILGAAAYKVHAMDQQIQHLIEKLNMTLHAEWKSGGVTYTVTATQQDEETAAEFRARFAEMVSAMKELFPPS